MTTEIKFPEINHREVRGVVCGGCGKRLRRQRTFSQTVSQFNRNPDGTQRTRGEIRAELRRQAAEWAPEAICLSCAEETSPPEVSSDG